MSGSEDKGTAIGRHIGIEIDLIDAPGSTSTISSIVTAYQLWPFEDEKDALEHDGKVDSSLEVDDPIDTPL